MNSRRKRKFIRRLKADDYIAKLFLKVGSCLKVGSKSAVVPSKQMETREHS